MSPELQRLALLHRGHYETRNSGTDSDERRYRCDKSEDCQFRESRRCNDLEDCPVADNERQSKKDTKTRPVEQVIEHLPR